MAPSRSRSVPTRPDPRLARLALGASLVLLAAAFAPSAFAARPAPVPPVAAATAVPFAYRCTSTAGSTDETYVITGTVPATVVQGTTFGLTVIVTGTPSVDLLLDHLTVGLDTPVGVTALDGLSRTIAGPGSSTPPGPVAKAGIPNSTPPLTFSFLASGAVGTVVPFFSGEVSTIAVEIGNPANRLPVTCARVQGGAFAQTTIVAVPPSSTTTTSSTSTTSTSTTTTSSTSTTTTTTTTAIVGSATVLGEAVSAPVAVQASPSFTG